jgi:hypothetical protein
VIAAPIIFSVLILGMELPSEGAVNPYKLPLDRAQLVDSLERLARTGEPRHVTHDDGQELDETLKEALAAGGDVDLQWLATRAAAPLVPAIQRPLSSRTRTGGLSVRAERVLTLPWTVDYVADIDARLDDGPWQKILRVTSGVSENRSLDKLLPRAAAIAPGFHTLSLRARIRYGELPAGMPRRETRELLTLNYGIWGSAGKAADPVRPFFDSAASVSAQRLDPNLPDVPFTSWLAQLPRDPNDSAATDWRTEWCGLRESMSDENLVPGDVCVVARRSGLHGSFTEIWIKAGTLRHDGNGSKWVRTYSAFMAAYLYHGQLRVRVPIAAVPGYLAGADEDWPSARIVVNAAGISVASPNVLPGVPTTLRILVANLGDADANGITINVVAASETDLPATHRAFVRTIRAGGSIEIETPITLPARYGVVDVLIVPGHDDISARTGSNENHHAYAVINQRAAPAGYLQRLCLELGKPSGSCSR